MILLVTSIYLLHSVFASDTVITNITDATKLNSQFLSYGSAILQPMVISTYFDPTAFNTPYNYLFIPLSSSNTTYSLSSNVYNSKLQQYKNADNPSLTSILPTQETSNLYFNGYLESFSSCISPQTLDIIICYQQPQLNNDYNISIQCNIFYNNKSSQTWSNAFKVSEYFFQQSFTNVICFDNTYLIIWANFIYYENSWIRYSLIDLNGNIKLYNIPLSLGNITYSFCFGWLTAISSPFRNPQNNNQIFLLEVMDESETQYVISVFAEYNQSYTNSNDTIVLFNTPIYQSICDDIVGFSLYYMPTIIHHNNQCCFLIPYTDSDNNTYVSVMDIFGDLVLENDTFIVSGHENLWVEVMDLYNGYWIVIYDSFDVERNVIIYGNIYLLTSVNNNEYHLEIIETEIELQKWYNRLCIFCANTISVDNQTQLFVSTSVGIEIASKADIYAQTFTFAPP
eukprot:462814_1